MSLLSLPDEMLVHILSYLYLKDILAFSATNRTLYRLYKDSIRLRYLVELESVGCTDSAWANGDEESIDGIKPSLQKCLKYLRLRESRWEELDLSKNAVNLSVSGNHRLSLYDLSAGIFAYAAGDPKDGLRYINLREASKIGATMAKSSVPDNLLQTGSVSWEHFRFDNDLADFGLALREHDLIVCVSCDSRKSVDQEEPNTVLDLRAHFIRFSTQKAHELAREPVINLVKTSAVSYGRPNPIIEIVGSFVVIILTFPRAVDEHHIEYLYIFNWKTGKELLKRTYAKSTYPSVVFVTQSLLVLPNVAENSLDLVHIRNSGDTVWLLRLQLPNLENGSRLVSVACRSDPNPEASNFDPITAACCNFNCCDNRQIDYGQKNSNPKWRAEEYGITADPSLALISFNLYVTSINNFNFGPTMNFVIHRSALVDVAVKALSCMKETIENAEMSCSPSFATPIPWEQWGPASTRWRLEDDIEEWITTTAGQRQTLSAVAEDEWNEQVIVIRDYNPYAVSRAKAKAKEKDSLIHVDSSDGLLETDLESEIEDEVDGTQSISSDTDSDGGSGFEAGEISGFENENALSIRDWFVPGVTIRSIFESNSVLNTGTPLNNQENNEVANENFGLGQEERRDSIVLLDLLGGMEDSKKSLTPFPLKLKSTRVRDTLVRFNARCYKKGTICCGLPCVEYTVRPPDNPYTGLLLDEERIITYCEDEVDETFKSLEVFSMYP